MYKDQYFSPFCGLSSLYRKIFYFITLFLFLNSCGSSNRRPQNDLLNVTASYQLYISLQGVLSCVSLFALHPVIYLNVNWLRIRNGIFGFTFSIFGKQTSPDDQQEELKIETEASLSLLPSVKVWTYFILCLLKKSEVWLHKMANTKGLPASLCVCGFGSDHCCKALYCSPNVSMRLFSRTWLAPYRDLRMETLCKKIWTALGAK